MRLVRDEFRSTGRVTAVDGPTVHCSAMTADGPKYDGLDGFAAESVAGLASVLVAELEFRYLHENYKNGHNIRKSYVLNFFFELS